MASADYQGPLSGHVEIDETWVGGKKRRVPREKNRKPGPTGRHALVFGMVEREGHIRAGVIPRREANDGRADHSRECHARQYNHD